MWRENDWRCEFHPGFGGSSRLAIYRGEDVVAAEQAGAGKPAYHRAEVLRQRVLRGDLRPDS